MRRVRKRDGREEPFDKAKIAAAVARAQAAVGANDPQFAGEVAEIVEMALVRRQALERGPGAVAAGAPEPMPGIEEIQDLVEQALIELGQAQVAKAYILYRDRRARIRSALQVRGDAVRGSHGEIASPHGPRVQVSDGLESWKKSRIVAALLDEADLPRATAEQVAARVEERVFDSGLKRISTALIRELVDNELVDMGLSQALRKQRPVGVPRHDLRRMLSEVDPPDPRGESLEPRGAEARIAAEVLRRYALEDILPESSSELHLSGEISIEDLERPHLSLCASIPCELLLRGELGPRSAFELLDELASIARDTSYGVVLEDCGPLLQVLSRAAGSSTSSRGTRTLGVPVSPASSGTRPAAVSGFLLAVGALARALDRHIDLCIAPSTRAEPAGGATTPGWLARTIEELVELEDERGGGSSPRIFLDAGDIHRFAASSSRLAGALDTLLQRGRLVPTHGAPDFGDSSDPSGPSGSYGASSSSGSRGRRSASERFAGERFTVERFAGPGLRRSARERGALWCGGSCALNLPRAARRAGAWREDALFEDLARLVEQALDALVALREFQRSERSGRSGRSERPRGRLEYALVPVGLREALRWLGDGEVRPEQGARVLAFLDEALQRFGRARGMSVVLTPFFGERAAQRFAALDAALFQFEQPLLFEASTDRPSRGAPYSTGYDLAPESPGLASVGPALPAREAALVSVLASGALHPPTILRSLVATASSEEHPWLAALHRLEQMRARLCRGADARDRARLVDPDAPDARKVAGASDAESESRTFDAVRERAFATTRGDLYAPFETAIAGSAPRERADASDTGDPPGLHSDDT